MVPVAGLPDATKFPADWPAPPVAAPSVIVNVSFASSIVSPTIVTAMFWFSLAVPKNASGVPVVTL